MQIRLRFFASVRETVGHGSLDHVTQARTVAALRDELCRLHPAWAEALGGHRCVRASLNQRMVDDSAELLAGAEVGFFPPVTGG